MVVYQIIPISKKLFKVIAIDLSKEQSFDADPKAIQQINSTGNLDEGGALKMFFTTE